ncbi:hypothetical protein KVR01_003497 [Diaporthe batatas]|uniref:uncharacterized protein n=1 Tax=Diaporthe batatas TaxID=748121 RepID=UPI001D043F76|nr:uncharacterized protein KVR01_003497 [Diaporthe batatas]KAG8167808.1 hypothetical protein KVR01_003497 [Diaporthe batatas]
MEDPHRISRQETNEGGGSDESYQEVLSTSESEGIDDDFLEGIATNLIGFGHEDGYYEGDSYDVDDELQREAEAHPRVQSGNKYMKGPLFKMKLDELIKDKQMDRNDPVVKLLYDHGFNELPEWDLSTAHSLRGEVARAVAGCCESEDVEIDKLDPCERVLAECVMHHLEIQKSIGGTIASSALPILEELTDRQWARELYKYIHREWRQFFQPDQEELPDVTKYLSNDTLPIARGVYVAMLIGKVSPKQHDHLYVGSALNSKGGVRTRQQDRRRQYDGTEEPQVFFDKLMCQKDPTTEERVRDFPVWGNPLAFPDEAFNSYTRGLFMFVLGRLAEAVFALRLGATSRNYIACD